MSDFITLTCPSCNGKLQITKDIERFTCLHCANEHIVKRGGGIIAIKPVLESMTKGVDNTASELAIVRLDKEIAEVEKSLLPLKSSLDKTGGRVIFGTILILVGVVGLFDSGCVVGGVILIGIGAIMILANIYGHEKKPEVEKLEEKLKELKTSRQSHYDKVNK